MTVNKGENSLGGFTLGGFLWPTLIFVAIFYVFGRERENGAGESKVLSNSGSVLEI